MKAEMLQQEVHPGWNLFLCFMQYEVYQQIYHLKCLGCSCFGGFFVVFLMVLKMRDFNC